MCFTTSKQFVVFTFLMIIKEIYIAIRIIVTYLRRHSRISLQRSPIEFFSIFRVSFKGIDSFIPIYSFVVYRAAYQEIVDMHAISITPGC